MIVKIGYTYLNYEDGDYYETPLIHSVTTTRPDGSETLYYTYDERGNITSIRRGVNDIVCRYTYDDLGQLIREDNRAHGATYTWTYDNAGNILSSKTYAYTTGSLGSAQRTASYNYSSGSWGDLLTSNNGRSVTYDNIGNPLRWNDYGELTWQGRRLMRYYESEMECESLYTYNADGIRTSKTVNGVKHTYHLSGTQILSEEWTDRWNRHVMVYIYDAAGQPIGMTHFQDGTLVDTYLYEKNIQGDVVAVYDYAGNLVVRYAYNAWGAVSETEYGSEYCEESFEVLCNPFRYRGYYYDTETDLYYLNSRYYDPAVGRFLNADSYINANGDLIGFNMFAYCSNNPVMGYDPTGKSILGAIFLIVAVVAVSILATGCISAPDDSWEGTPIDPRPKRVYDSEKQAVDALLQECYDEANSCDFDYEYGAVIFQYEGDDRYYSDGPYTELKYSSVGFEGCYPYTDPKVYPVATIHTHRDYRTEAFTDRDMKIINMYGVDSYIIERQNDHVNVKIKYLPRDASSYDRWAFYNGYKIRR